MMTIQKLQDYEGKILRDCLEMNFEARIDFTSDSP